MLAEICLFSPDFLVLVCSLDLSHSATELGRAPGAAHFSSAQQNQQATLLVPHYLLGLMEPKVYLSKKRLYLPIPAIP